MPRKKQTVLNDRDLQELVRNYWTSIGTETIPVKSPGKKENSGVASKKSQKNIRGLNKLFNEKGVTQMLKAFYNQLRSLAVDKNDPFHQHVQKRVGERAKPVLEAELKEAIVLIPSIMGRISVLWAQLEKGSRIKDVGSYFIAYMYNSQDFIPEDDAHGLFGYLDDTYLVVLIYDLLTEELESTQKSLTKEDKKLQKKLIGIKKKIKSVIPDEATKIQQMIGEILVGEDTSFNDLFVESNQSKK